MDSDRRKTIDKYKDEIYQLNNRLKNYEDAIEIERAGGDITMSEAFFDLQQENKALNAEMKNTLAENASQSDEISKLKQEIQKLKASEANLKKQNENQKSINK